MTLRHSCLSSIPFFNILVSVPNWIEKMLRDFLWSGMAMGRTNYLVRWDLVCGRGAKGVCDLAGWCQ